MLDEKHLSGECLLTVDTFLQRQGEDSALKSCNILCLWTFYEGGIDQNLGSILLWKFSLDKLHYSLKLLSSLCQWAIIWVLYSILLKLFNNTCMREVYCGVLRWWVYFDDECWNKMIIFIFDREEHCWKVYGFMVVIPKLFSAYNL